MTPTEFLEDLKFSVEIGEGVEECPPWNGKLQCEHVHGKKYVVSIVKSTGETMEYLYWSSLRAMEAGMEPIVDDIVYNLAEKVILPEDPDEIYLMIGPIAPSVALAMSESVKKVNEFLSEEEIKKFKDFLQNS